MFILVNDIQQSLKESLFGPGWRHLATVKIPSSTISKERYFMLLLERKTGETYIEEYVDFPFFFKKIDDDKLWSDLYFYFTEKKFISVGSGNEFKIAKKE